MLYMFISGRGGAREGSGRPSAWNNKKTVAVRVPECFSEQLLEYAKQLDNGNASQVIVNVKNQNILQTEIQDLKRDLEETQLELQKTRSQLQKLVASEQDALRLLATCHTEAFKAADILKAALKLKAGNGGAIKVQIKEALKLIDDV